MTANELLYLLVGAGLALGGQLVLQLRIVPRVEARKRREDRWERDLLALGELLTAELPDRATEAKAAQSILHTVAGVEVEPGSRDADQQREAEHRLSAKAEEAAERYYAVAQTRMTWLVRRIVGVAPQSIGLREFDFLHTRFRLASAGCTYYTYTFVDFDEKKFEERWQDEHRLREQLTDAVEKLIGNPPPRNPSWTRRRWRALAGWTRRTLKVRRDAKDVGGEGEAG